MQEGSQVDLMQTESIFPAARASSEAGEGSTSPKRRRRAATNQVTKDDMGLHKLSPDELQRVLRRRMTNRQSAMRMRAKRQQEVDDAHLKV